ncbi:MAG: D-Ala-D-Ala carboxypeptidase family metallohydrolase [Gemmatimonadota bacterium]
MTARELRRERYREWLLAQQLRFGFANELANLANRVNKGVTNDTPPVDVWHAILPTVRLVEQVRQRFGTTVLHSAYRSTLYNATHVLSGAVKDSRHTHNDALDFACGSASPREWADFLRDLRDGGAFKGGIGVYRTFAHVDTRGTNADWTG